MLNWRRDPGLEKKIEDAKRRSLEAEKRTMQLSSETEQIVKETEQLKLENAKLWQLNARGRELLSSAALLCLAPESSSTPPSSTAHD